MSHEYLTHIRKIIQEKYSQYDVLHNDRTFMRLVAQLDSDGETKTYTGWMPSYADDFFELFCVRELVRKGISHDPEVGLTQLLSAIHDGWAIGRLVDYDPNTTVIKGGAFDLKENVVRGQTTISLKNDVEIKIDLDELDASCVYDVQMTNPFYSNREFVACVKGNRFIDQFYHFDKLLEKNKGEAAKDCATLFKIFKLNGVNQIGKLSADDFHYELPNNILANNYDRFLVNLKNDKEKYNKVRSIIGNI
jgi:hypothetical protein